MKRWGERLVNTYMDFKYSIKTTIFIFLGINTKSAGNNVLRRCEL